jgi:hypothetical protein
MSLRFTTVLATCLTIAAHAAHGAAGSSLQPLVSATPLPPIVHAYNPPEPGLPASDSPAEPGVGLSPILPMPYPKWPTKIAPPADPVEPPV